MCNSSSSPTLTRCTFTGNSATDDGGGMRNVSSSPALTNCTFTGNSAADGGGICNSYSSPTLANCTFTGNSAKWYGGGMYSSFSSPTLTNCILWSNGTEIRGSDATVTYSCIEGGYTGNGNITENPRFVDAANGDVRLAAGSPCIDAGDNAAPGLPATDPDGNDRRFDDSAVPDTGNGTAPIVDMGAYERMALDSDGDGLPDDVEQVIIDADAQDGVAGYADVLPHDDFDGDGFPNLVEYRDGTDPVNEDQCPDGWMWTLSVDGSQPSAVTFGMTPDATDDWDEAIDAAADGTARETMGSLVIRNGNVTYQRNILAGSDEGEWLLVADPSAEGPITVSWRVPSSLPADRYVALQEVDDTGHPVTAGIYVDMMELTGLTIPAGQMRFLAVRYGSAAITELRLGEGWNLVSLAHVPTDPSVETVFGDSAILSGVPNPVFTGAVWHWDAPRQLYVRASELHPLQGVWVYAQSDALIEMRGTPLDAAERWWHLGPGWNLVSPVTNMGLPPAVTGDCWPWNSSSETYQATDRLHVLEGHWLYVDEETDVDIEEQGR